MNSRTSEMPYLNQYATKTLENDCFIDLEGGKLCLSYLLAVISEKCSRPMYFLIKIKSHCVRMYRMQITKKAVAILSLICTVKQIDIKLVSHFGIKTFPSFF